MVDAARKQRSLLVHARSFVRRTVVGRRNGGRIGGLICGPGRTGEEEAYMRFYAKRSGSRKLGSLTLTKLTWVQ